MDRSRTLVVHWKRLMSHHPARTTSVAQRRVRMEENVLGKRVHSLVRVLSHSQDPPAVRVSLSLSNPPLCIEKLSPCHRCPVCHLFWRKFHSIRNHRVLSQKKSNQTDRRFYNRKKLCGSFLCDQCGQWNYSTNGT